jgi:hypothetical protein
MIVSKSRVCVAIIYCAATWSVSAAEAGSSATNETAAALSNRPPVTLTQVLRTNLVGTYKLAPVWTGKCVVAVATGMFRKPEPPVFATNRYALKFDTAVIAPKKAVGNVGPKGIARSEKDGGYSVLHTYHDSLPSDSQIKSAATQADLEKVLGLAHGFPAMSGRGEESRVRLQWAFFSLKKDASLDTLDVTAIVEKRLSTKQAYIDSLEILRGNAWPEIKSPKKS